MRENGSILGRKVLGPEENDSDSTITGFVLQQHLPSLLDFLSHTQASIRYAALQLIGTLLRQGKCSVVLCCLLYLLTSDLICDKSIVICLLSFLLPPPASPSPPVVSSFSFSYSPPSSHPPPSFPPLTSPYPPLLLSYPHPTSLRSLLLIPYHLSSSTSFSFPPLTSPHLTSPHLTSLYPLLHLPHQLSLPSPLLLLFFTLSYSSLTT
jgi:hypothetical protein